MQAATQSGLMTCLLVTYLTQTPTRQAIARLASPDSVLGAERWSQEPAHVAAASCPGCSGNQSVRDGRGQPVRGSAFAGMARQPACRLAVLSAARPALPPG